MSDSEDATCPLCMEEMDLIDRNFVPCPCGYRVCMWCWHHIRENLNGLCPACRVPYKEDPHAFAAVDSTEVVKKNKERKQKEKQERKVSDRPTTNKVQPIDRKHLHNYRVVQRNLVYIIGVPGSIASEDTLRKAEYFGQYGRINKVVVHRNHSSSHPTVSAYITFAFKEDAKAAIQALEGFWLEGHQMRASFGTTKYCNNFIRGALCNNPECVYLHELGEDEDRFTKEEIQAGYSKLMQQPGRDQTIVTGAGGPSGTGKRTTGEPVLPPPVFVQDLAVAERNNRVMRNISSASAGEDEAENKVADTSSPTPVQAQPQNDSNTATSASTAQQSTASKVAVKKGAGDVRPVSSQSDNISSSNGAVPVNSATSNTSTSVKTPQPLQTQTQPQPQKGIISAATGKGAVSSSVDDKLSAAQLAKSKQQAQRTQSDRNIGSGSNGATPSTETQSIPQKGPDSTSISSTPTLALPVDSNVDTASTPSTSVSDTSSTHTVATGTASSFSSSSGVGSVSLAGSEGTVQSASASISGLVSQASFNGLGNCAVFPVPVSSLSVSIWSNVLRGSTDDLKSNPYALITIPVTELFELTIPPVDAACMSVWPKPISYYSQGVGANGVTRAPAGQHTFYRSSSSQHLPAVSESSSASLPSVSVVSTQQQLYQQQQQQQQQPSSFISNPPSVSYRPPVSGGAVSGGQQVQGGQQQPTIAALQQMFPGVNMAFGPPKMGQSQQQQAGYNSSGHGQR